MSDPPVLTKRVCIPWWAGPPPLHHQPRPAKDGEWAGRDSWGRKAAQVSWVALGNLSAPELLAVGQFVFSSDARLTVAQDPAARRWSLVIESAVKKDTGWYECQVNTVPHTSHRLHLAVIGGAAPLHGAHSHSTALQSRAAR